MELTLIVRGLDSYFAGSLYQIFRDLLQISCRWLKDLPQRCRENDFWNVFSLKERLDRDQNTDYKVKVKYKVVGMSLSNDLYYRYGKQL